MSTQSTILASVKRAARAKLRAFLRLAMHEALKEHVAIAVSIDVIEAVFGFDVVNTAATIIEDGGGAVWKKVLGGVDVSLVSHGDAISDQWFEAAVVEMTIQLSEAARDVAAGRATVTSARERFAPPLVDPTAVLPPYVPRGAGSVYSFARAMAALYKLPVSQVESFYLRR